MLSKGSLLVTVLLLNFSVFTEQLEYSPDVPISLATPDSDTPSATGIEACKMSSSSLSYFNSRVYAVKTSDRSEYVRHFVNAYDQQCFDDTTDTLTVFSTDFGSCAEMTAAGAYNSFSYNAGKCTAYNTWRPVEMSTCNPGEGEPGEPIYVVKLQLTDFKGASEKQVTVEVVDRGIHTIDLEMSVSDPCHMENEIAEYVIMLDGEEMARVPFVFDETVEYTLTDPALCTQDELTVQVTAVDASGTVLSNLAEVIVPDSEPPTRFLLSFGDCVAVYDNVSPAKNYIASQTFCSQKDANATLFTEYVDGQFAEYAGALTAIKDTGSDDDEDHFVYIARGGLATWTWQGSDLNQPRIDSDVWGFFILPQACAYSDESDDFKLIPTQCSTTFTRVVCYLKFSS